MQEEINNIKESLIVQTRDEFANYANEIGEVKLGEHITYTLKQTGRYREISDMNIVVSVGSIRKDALVKLEEGGFKVYNANYGYDRDRNNDDVFINQQQAWINTEQPIEDSIQKLHDYYNWNSELPNLLHWINSDFTHNLNHNFINIVAKYNELCKLQTDLENYDTYQYEQFVSKSIESGVVEVKFTPDINYDTDENDALSKVRVWNKVGHIWAKHQTDYGTKRESMIEGNVKITPIKGGKFEFEWQDSVYRNGKVVDFQTKGGIFTKLQFNNFMEKVWHHNTKTYERYVESFNETLDVLKYDYQMNFELPLEVGDYIPVDGVLTLQTEKQSV